MEPELNQPDERLLNVLDEEYGLDRVSLEPLDLGADPNAAVYRLTAAEGQQFFLKHKRLGVQHISLALPHWLQQQGVSGLTAPIPNLDNDLSTAVEQGVLILYPFLNGKDGYQTRLTENHWLILGQVFRRLHESQLPTALLEQVPGEQYDPAGRDYVELLCAADFEWPEEPIAAELHEYLSLHRHTTLNLVARARHLAAQLAAEPTQNTVCHGDLHAGNAFIDAADNLLLIDWDEVVWAPKEKDLMSVGAGLMASGLSPQQEAARFYAGYGETDLNLTALSYFRCERIVQDLAVDGRLIVEQHGSPAERQQALHYFKANFLPGQTIDLAMGEGG